MASLLCVYSPLQPLSGDVKSMVPPLEMDWDQSTDMDSVLISVQNFIEQVERGGG